MLGLCQYQVPRFTNAHVCARVHPPPCTREPFHVGIMPCLSQRGAESDVCPEHEVGATVIILC